MKSPLQIRNIEHYEFTTNFITELSTSSQNSFWECMSTLHKIARANRGLNTRIQLEECLMPHSFDFVISDINGEPIKCIWMKLNNFMNDLEQDAFHGPPHLNWTLEISIP